MDKSFGDLQFLSDEFSKLEVVVAPAVQEGDDSGKAGTDSKLGRLRFFTTHVRRTMARIRDARSGRDPLSMSQLALLEEHIATATEGDGGGGGGGGVSSSRSSSVSSSMGGRAGVEELVGAGREEEEEWSVGLELHDEAFGSGGSVSLGLVSPAPVAVPDRGADGGIYDPHACSARLTPTSSSSSLSRLCWGSGGGTGGSAGGGGRDIARGGRPHRHTRRDHMDMLSQLEAEGVFAADDSYSPCCGGGGSRGGGGMGRVAFSPEARSMLGDDGESSRPGGCRGEEPVSLTAVKQEEEEGSVPCEMPLPLSSEVKQELSEDKPLVSATAAAAAAAEPQATTAGGALCPGGTAPLVEKPGTKAAAAAVTPPSSEPETARAAVAPDPHPA
ncbi:unnamed protein product, partial [Ectocarpus sp. 12 AP-2014]